MVGLGMCGDYSLQPRKVVGGRETSLWVPQGVGVESGTSSKQLEYFVWVRRGKVCLIGILV